MKMYNIDNLLDKAILFHELNPKYTITDTFTHKNVIFPK